MPGVSGSLGRRARSPAFRPGRRDDRHAQMRQTPPGEDHPAANSLAGATACGRPAQIHVIELCPSAPQKAVPGQRPAATTPIDRCEPSLQSGGHRAIIAVVLRHVAEQMLSEHRSPRSTLHRRVAVQGPPDPVPERIPLPSELR